MFKLTRTHEKTQMRHTEKKSQITLLNDSLWQRKIFVRVASSVEREPKEPSKKKMKTRQKKKVENLQFTYAKDPKGEIWNLSQLCSCNSFRIQALLEYVHFVASENKVKRNNSENAMENWLLVRVGVAPTSLRSPVWALFLWSWSWILLFEMLKTPTHL